MGTHRDHAPDDRNNPPEPVTLYASWLAAELKGIFGARLRGVYLHGSAAMGGWNPRSSDVDLLAVIDDAASDDEKQRISDVVLGAGRRPPGTGLEFSLVSTATYDAHSNTPAFELHVTTGGDAKVIDGTGHPGDPDLVLHFAVCRERGVTVFGLPAAALLSSFPRGMVLDALLAELEWACGNASWHYAVLNACRARAFAADGDFLSKVEGAEWAIARELDPSTVAAALDFQHGHFAVVADERVRQFMDAALRGLNGARAAGDQ